MKMVANAVGDKCKEKSASSKCSTMSGRARVMQDLVQLLNTDMENFCKKNNVEFKD